MLKFKDIEHLVCHLIDKLDEEDRASVIAGPELAVELMEVFLSMPTVSPSLIDVNTYEYDKEYAVSLFRDNDSNKYRLAVERIYRDDIGCYLSPMGYILFHECVNCKAWININNNKLLTECDWFVIGDDDVLSETKEDENKKTFDMQKNDAPKESYKINGKEVTEEEYSSVANEFMKKYDEYLSLLNKTMDELHEWINLLYW